MTLKRFSQGRGVAGGLLIGLILVVAGLGMAASDQAGDTGRTRSGSRRSSSVGSGSYDSGLGINSGRSIFGSRSKTGANKNQQTDRDKQRADQQRDKTRAKASNQPGAAGAKAAPKEAKTVKGKQPPAKKAASGSTGRGANTVEFKMQADASANVLFIEALDVAPTMHVVIEQRKHFVTRVVFRNGKRSTFDVVELAIKYDPSVVRPVGLDDEGLSGLLAEPATAQYDAKRGLIVYRARFAEPRKDEMLALFRLEWEALAPTEYSRIDFVNNESFASRVMSKEINVLQKRTENDEVEASERAGLLGMDVTITADAATAEELSERDLPVSAVSMARMLSEGTAEGNVTLALRPRVREVRIGEDFLVDVTYANPQGVEIDSIRFKVKFDPKVLQVVDYDENNWITKGINIFDGDYHEDLPFDFHIRNVAYNGAGEVVYEMGFSSRTAIASSGVIATIKFRAIAPAETTRIEFDIDEDSKKSKTSVSFLGFNLIGEPGNRAAALTNASVRVYE